MELLSPIRQLIHTVGETPNTNADQAILYTDSNRHELNMVFNFDHMHIDYSERGKFDVTRFQLTDLKRVFTQWQNKLSDHGWNSLYWSNHDQPRAVTRFGSEKYRVESAKSLATVLHMLKGTPYIFQGEEIGMTNAKFDSLTDYQDIETKNIINLYKEEGLDESFIKRVAYLRSRDNARTPMPWQNEKPYAGFSQNKPWIKMNPNYDTINVAQALMDTDSVFYHYQRLIALRHKLDVVVNGKYQLYDAKNEKVYTFSRTANDGTTLLVIALFSEDKLFYTLPLEVSSNNWQVILNSYPEAIFKNNLLELNPYQSIIMINE